MSVYRHLGDDEHWLPWMEFEDIWALKDSRSNSGYCAEVGLSVAVAHVFIYYKLPKNPEYIWRELVGAT
ncbi:unnamed protein product [Fusarium graminearum]|nr:unnamed protein product [Fusarium graminearum]